MSNDPRDAQLALGVAPRVIVVTVPELEALIRMVVRTEVRGSQQESADAVLSTDQVAELLHVSPRSVPKMVNRDALPTLGIVGRGYLFRRADVLGWLQARAGAAGKHSTLHVNRLRRAQGAR